MKFRGSHFRYNKHQKNGIFFLLLLIIGVQLLVQFVDFSESDLSMNSTIIESFVKEHDSLLKKRNEQELKKPFLYYPNYLKESSAYKLGMSYEAYEKLRLFRKGGGYINTKAQFQQVTGLSDSLIKTISPQLKFNNKTQQKKIKQQVEEVFEINDLNLATAEDLKRINGIGEVLAERIIKYRNLLKGYTFESQLYEVWNLKPETADRVLEQFKILDLPKIKRLNVNEASFKEILALPYIDYELTRKIVEFREEVAEIQHIDQLKKIDSFPLEKFDRITLYLWAE